MKYTLELLLAGTSFTIVGRCLTSSCFWKPFEGIKLINYKSIREWERKLTA